MFYFMKDIGNLDLFTTMVYNTTGITFTCITNFEMIGNFLIQKKIILTGKLVIILVRTCCLFFHFSTVNTVATHAHIELQ